ncbi:hypothetical protein [Amycolatopsis sp. cmx-4-83]|uniref:hypothetical protein n=1 Tax=Amycolatopsis sp. cmx-4-83 TaxID=2790940 RepID=UPI00397D9227
MTANGSSASRDAREGGQGRLVTGGIGPVVEGECDDPLGGLDAVHEGAEELEDPRLRHLEQRDRAGEDDEHASHDDDPLPRAAGFPDHGFTW